MNPSNRFSRASRFVCRKLVALACLGTLALASSNATAQGSNCNPQACGTNAVFPLLQGGKKGAPITVQNGQTVCVDIRMENSILPIDAYGYTVQYDATVLTLQSIQTGSIFADFLITDCNQTGPGTIVCGGFGENAILPNSSGVLATLCFIATCPPGAIVDSSSIVITNLRDDLLPMSACCNLVICSNPPQGPCPGAALYLTQPGVAIGSPASAKSGESFTLLAGLKDIPQPVDSFSFAIRYDTTAMRFVSAKPGNLLANFLDKECREISPGVLACSGANNVAIPALSAGELFHLTFSANCIEGDTSNVTLNALAKDFADVQACNVRVACKGCEPGNCPGAAVYIAQVGKQLGDKLTEQDGDSVRFEVRVKNNPQGLFAYGFRLQYDPAHLSFGSVSRGLLTNGFVASTAKLLTPGTLVCAGFGTTGIPVNSSGALLRFSFGVNCNVGDSTELKITDLTDDLTGFLACCNYFSCAPCDHDGDLNTDKSLTPGDALCAFDIFLSGGILPANCDHPQFNCELVAADVNCDNAITSRDALAIFSRALQGLPPADCFAKPVSNTGGKSGAPAHLRLINGPVAAAPETLRVQLQIASPHALNAFGMLLQYPARNLKFIGVQRLAATQNWVVLKAQEYLPGMIVIGGFHHETLTSAADETLFEVAFLNSGEVIDNHTFAVSNLTDDFAHASFTSALNAAQMSATPRQFKLYQNYPNPLHLGANAGTMIQYDLPATLHDAKVEIIIYNLQGQIVKRLYAGRQTPGAYTLSWNGRDENGLRVPAGTYQYRLTAGDYVEQRKLVIVK